MPKNFKNEPTTKALSLKAMPLMIKFGWTANISRLNVTASWRQSSLGRSGYSILLGSEHTSWSFLGSREFMIFSTCHCWSKILLGRGRWIKKSDKWRSIPATMMAGNTKWRQFGTVRFRQESQKVIYQDYTIWYLGKDIRKKKIPRNQLQQSSISKGSSARFRKIILISQLQFFLLLTLHHWWLDWQSSSLSFPNKSKDD